MRTHQLSFVLAGALSLAICGEAAAQKHTAPQRPNVVMIVADDLGFSDLGAFGGEIDTPHLDALANAGLRLTDFHAAPACSPTRAMLLSGTDNHTAGVGAMAEVPIGKLRNAWGYEGVISGRVATLAERLQAGGYRTIMSGKWHLGSTPETLPSARGFERSFALLQGAANHFGPGGFGDTDAAATAATYLNDGKAVQVGHDFYSSDDFTTRLIEKLEAGNPRQPFFAYLAFTAPHSPLQAPKESIAKYRGRYDDGWAALRARRLERMKQLGLIAAATQPHELVPDAASWEKLSAHEKRIESRKMEVYAAMVDRLDWNVGRLIAYLKRSGQYDDTLFIFISDNGPAGEVADMFTMLPGVRERAARADNSLEGLGSASSFVFYGPYWAQAASAPFRLHKAVITEGGTRVAAFITYAQFKRQQAIGTAFATVMDILPTVLAATNVPLSPAVAGRTVASVRGRSMLPYLLERTDGIDPIDAPVALEFHGQASVRQGQWKLVRLGKPWGEPVWALYDLAVDPAERIDLSTRLPQRRDAMIAAWNTYATEAKVVQQ